MYNKRDKNNNELLGQKFAKTKLIFAQKSIFQKKFM